MKLVGRSLVSAITQTPASGPLAARHHAGDVALRAALRLQCRTSVQRRNRDHTEQSYPNQHTSCRHGHTESLPLKRFRLYGRRRLSRRVDGDVVRDFPFAVDFPPDRDKALTPDGVVLAVLAEIW